MLVFDKNKPRKVVAWMNVSESKSKNIDPVSVTAAIDYLLKEGVSYNQIKQRLKISGHTEEEAKTLCDACWHA